LALLVGVDAYAADVPRATIRDIERTSFPATRRGDRTTLFRLRVPKITPTP
jgi:hypothetical protein